MAYARLSADAQKITVTRSVSEKHQATLEDGTAKNFWSTSTEVLGTISVTEPVLSIKALEAEEAEEIQSWLDNQLEEIRVVSARNASQGIYNGQPVIKRNKSDDHKYRNHPGFVPGRKTGEFLGVIQNVNALGLPGTADASMKSDDEWAEEARKDIYGLNMQGFHRLLKVVPDCEFTDEEATQISVYSQTLTKFIGELQDDRFRTRTSNRKGSNPEEVEQRKAVVEANVARNKAESARLMQTFGISE